MKTSSLDTTTEIVEVKPGKKFALSTLSAMLPDIQTLLFFCKVYTLDATMVSYLLSKLFKTSLVDALLNEGDTHSVHLQSYVVDELLPHSGLELDDQRGTVTFEKLTPKPELLAHMWEQIELVVADSIKQVAEKLGDIVGVLPGKNGHMVFSSMMKLNVKRPTLGDYRAGIHHPPAQPNLVILDVSGSMTESTIRRIVDDVVSLSYTANAHLAVVSNTCTWWEPGTFSTDDVLRASEFSGTHYEELAQLMDMDWGVIVTVADYDSSHGAKDRLSHCTGSVDTVLDVSLVNKPTFLAECVGQKAKTITPMLIATSNYVLNA